MKRFACASVALLACCCAWGADIAKVYRWDSVVEDGTVFPLAPTRGETMILQPRLMSYGLPMDISTATNVVLLYTAVGSTNVYRVAGSVVDGSNGITQVTFGSENELTNSTYAYDVLVSGSNSTVVGARGAIRYRDGVAWGAQLSTNAPIRIIDFAQVEVLNAGAFPYTLARTNGPTFVLTNVVNNVTSVLWFVNGVCTNIMMP